VPEYIYSDDIFIVSYPKSGNTWMRFLIGNYLTGNECSFKNCHRITPDIHMNPDRCKEIDRPRFIKSHAPFQPQYPKVIYIVRDARDVAVSYYYHALKHRSIEESTSFESFVDDFNNGAVDSFGTWSNHVSSWLDGKDEDQLLLVRYESMLDDSARELSRVLSFSGIDIDEAAVESAAEASDFKNMQRQEKEQYSEVDVLPKSDSSKRFLRSGKRGDWEAHFSEELLHSFLSKHGDALNRLGYNTPEPGSVSH
jgi:hypothetical protein